MSEPAHAVARPRYPLKLSAADAARGQEEGDKDRPAVIVVAGTATGMPRVLALPITHATPAAGIAVMDIPQAVTRSAGLDAARSGGAVGVQRTRMAGFDLRMRIIPGRTPTTIGSSAYRRSLP